MIDMFMVHAVTVETKTGDGSYGPVFDAPMTLSPDDGTGVFVDETTRLVRASDGSEVASSTTILGPLAVADRLTVGSRVTLPSGDVTTVLSRSVHSLPGLGLPEHVEAACE